VVAAGARIIGDHRAVVGGWPPELPNLIWVPRLAHEPAGTAPTTGTLTGGTLTNDIITGDIFTGGAPTKPPAVPCADQLQLYGAPLVLGPLRSVSDAIDTLRHWPPYDQRGLGGYLDRMAAQIYRLSAAPDADASAP